MKSTTELAVKSSASSGPSSTSCHVRNNHPSAGPLRASVMTKNKTHHRRGVRERQRWQGKIRQRLVGRNRNHEWVARIARRLLERRAVDLDLWMGIDGVPSERQKKGILVNPLSSALALSAH